MKTLLLTILFCLCLSTVTVKQRAELVEQPGTIIEEKDGRIVFLEKGTWTGYRYVVPLKAKVFVDGVQFRLKDVRTPYHVILVWKEENQVWWIEEVRVNTKRDQ